LQNHFIEFLSWLLRSNQNEYVFANSQVHCHLSNCIDSYFNHDKMDKLSLNLAKFIRFLYNRTPNILINLSVCFFGTFLAMARILRDYSEISLKSEDLNCKIDLTKLIGRPGRTHIEIGSGKGTFLLNEAKSRPDENFLGIEWARKYYRYAVDRMGRWGLKNVRIIRTDATAFLTEHIQDNSVDIFHIYFPDPWPKKRHHKRRFICPTNLEQMIRCLKTSGEIRIATDHEDYFEQIEKVLDERSDKLEKIEFAPTAGAEPGERVGTNFERKYRKDQRPIHTIAVRK
jgi:tRNA (guanine-N7-)-methyltransferase